MGSVSVKAPTGSDVCADAVLRIRVSICWPPPSPIILTPFTLFPLPNARRNASQNAKSSLSLRRGEFLSSMPKARSGRLCQEHSSPCESLTLITSLLFFLSLLQETIKEALVTQVSFVSQDPMDKKIFSYITHEPAVGLMMCHTFSVKAKVRADRKWAAASLIQQTLILSPLFRLLLPFLFVPSLI